jgi:hypothetical protein
MKSMPPDTRDLLTTVVVIGLVSLCLLVGVARC